MKNKKLDALIVGAGITGLATAYYLTKRSGNIPKMAVLEAANHLGGTIQTVKESSCVLDGGADSFITAKPWGVELCKELGLEDQLIAPKPEAKKIFLVKKDKLYSLPDGIILGIPTKPLPFLLNQALPWSTKIRMALDWFIRPKSNGSPSPAHADESGTHFMKRHFGQKAVDLIFDPILGGIYAARADHVSMAAAFPNFLDMEKRTGSLIRGFSQITKSQKKTPKKPVFITLKNGLGDLIQALEKKFSPGILHPNHPVTRINCLGENQGYEVLCKNGKKWQAQHVVLALPSGQAKKILSGHQDLQTPLENFSSVSTATVFLGFRKQDLPQKFNQLPGMGFVVPRNERSPLLASTWISNKFSHRAPEDIFLIRCFWGGEGSEEYATLPKDALVQLTRKELNRLLAIDAQPLLQHVFFWNKQSPQYPVGHLENIAGLEQALTEFPGLFLIGNSYGGVGIPDCIRMAKRVSEIIISTCPK